MNPSSLSHDALSQLIGLIYEGPLEPVPWQQSLVAIRERLQANYVTLIVRSSTPEDLGLYVHAGNVTTEGYMSYATHYYVLDPSCEPNQAADQLLRDGDGLRVVGDSLEAVYSRENRELQRLIKRALPGHAKPELSVVEALSIARPSGKSNLGVVVRSVPMSEWSEGKHTPAAAVFVRDPEGRAQAPHEVVQQMFGLTPAEAALAMQLANGLSLDEAAAALAITRNTARAHLRAIFSKTGVTRQTELVRLVLNSVAILGDKD